MAAVEPVDAKGEVHHAHGGAGSHVSLSSMPFLQHTPENLKKLSLLDKVCFKFVTFVVKKRKKAFYLVTGFYVALMLLGMATRSMELSPQYQYAWIIDGKRNTKSRDMRLEAVEEVDKLDNSEVKPRDQQFQLLGTWIEYAGDGSDFFTAERLQTICEIERNLYDQKEWLDVCELDETEQCKIPALSILGKFYGSPWLYEMVNRRAAPCDLLEEADVTASWDAMVQAANGATDTGRKECVRDLAASLTQAPRPALAPSRRFQRVFPVACFLPRVWGHTSKPQDAPHNRPDGSRRSPSNKRRPRGA